MAVSQTERTVTFNPQEFRLFIATPCYGGLLTDEYHHSIMRLQEFCLRYGIGFQECTIKNESLIPRGRNTLVGAFMLSDATHLLFIDADIGFNPHDAFKLALHGKDVVVGAYPKKGLNWERIAAKAAEGEKELEKWGVDYVVNIAQHAGEHVVEVKDGLLEVFDGGNGFMCIKRNVIERMFKAYPDLKYANDLFVNKAYDDYLYALFDTMIDPINRRYLSEDYTFCRRWQDIGGTIYLDPAIALDHVGSHTYRGVSGLHLTANPQLRATNDAGYQTHTSSSD